MCQMLGVRLAMDFSERIWTTLSLDCSPTKRLPSLIRSNAVGSSACEISAGAKIKAAAINGRRKNVVCMIFMRSLYAKFGRRKHNLNGELKCVASALARDLNGLVLESRYVPKESDLCLN